MHIINNFKSNYSHVFDFEDEFVLGTFNFDLYARYSQENFKYFGSKKMELYSFSNNEHLFFKYLDDKIDFDMLKEFFLKIYNEFIVVDDKHMSSIITVVYVVNSMDEKTKKLIKKFSFYKSYMFGLKGFVNGKLIVLDGNENKAYENKLASGDAKKLGFIV